MERSAHGYWLADAGPVTAQPPLAAGDHRADVLVIGGGYLGMWAAWHLAERGVRVLLVERDLCGHGPSGRNGGFVNPLWDRAAELRELFGDDGARRVCEVSTSAIDRIDGWCAANDVDAHLRRAPMLEVAATASQLGDWDEGIAACEALGSGSEAEVLDAAGVRSVIDSDVFVGGVRWASGATIHPARLSLGLRERLTAHERVTVAERTEVTSFATHGDEVRATTPGGAQITAGSAVLAVNTGAARVRRLCRSLAVASSHVIATEPVPELIDQLGWTGGEGISDCRRMLHYFRTTRDGRVVFGWGGGRMGFGAGRPAYLNNDHAVQDAVARHLGELIPALARVRITHAWGGPIDVSPVHLPWFGSDGAVHYGFGFTGNGVGPASWGGELLADLATGTASELTALPNASGLPPKRFPPEPLRWAGGALIRRALVRVDDAEQAGGRADPFARGVARLPELLGLRLPR